MNNFGGHFPHPNEANKQSWQPNYYPHPSQQPQHNAYSANSLGAIYVSNIPLTSPPTPTTNSHTPTPQFDEHGHPIKIRKKPGRKPNPASPALRKAQNRAAQRAFRERKERHLKDLEGTIKQLREQRNSAVRELNQTKSKMDAFRAENWYLKGVVLTLQFVCLHHNIHIPTHSPYLTEEALSEMAKTTPHAIEAYVNAYTRNNINLKPTMAAHFANAANDEDATDSSQDNNNNNNNNNEESREEDELEDQRDEEDEDDSISQRGGGGGSVVDADTVMMMMDEVDENNRNYERRSLSSDAPSSYSAIKVEEEDETMTRWLKQHESNKKRKSLEENKPEDEYDEDGNKQSQTSSISAIQRIRLQLRVQSTISNVGKSAARLQPTILQLAIPHDPRIDLVPTPHMRDRMIIFRDQMDYDRCFAMLLNGALYHGGDPTMSASWELPPEFFTEFWYLAINYDTNRTDTWKRLKGGGGGGGEGERGVNSSEHSHAWNKAGTTSSEVVALNPPTAVFQQMDSNSHTNDTFASPHQTTTSSSDTVWTDDVFAQMTAGMPTLQPLDSNHLSSGFDFGSPPASMFDGFLLHRAHFGDNASPEMIAAHPMFEQLMGSSPDSRHERSPSLGAMMDLMHGLSTDRQPPS